MAQSEDIEIIWRAYELRPEGTPPADRSYIENSFKNHVAPMAKELGVEMYLPTVQPRTRLAHEAAAFGRQQGRGAEISDALFKAHWVHGRDIGQIEVLCDLGLQAGVDPVRLRECLEQRTLREEVEQELAGAHRYGIDAVPFFIYGGKVATRGLPTEELIRRAIARVRSLG